MGFGNLFFGPFINNNQQVKNECFYAVTLDEHLKRKEEIRKKQQQYDEEKLIAKKLKK